MKIAALFLLFIYFSGSVGSGPKPQPPAATIYKITQINILDNFILVV